MENPPTTSFTHRDREKSPHEFETSLHKTTLGCLTCFDQLKFNIACGIRLLWHVGISFHAHVQGLSQWVIGQSLSENGDFQSNYFEWWTSSQSFGFLDDMNAIASGRPGNRFRSRYKNHLCPNLCGAPNDIWVISSSTTAESYVSNSQNRRVANFEEMKNGMWNHHGIFPWDISMISSPSPSQNISNHHQSCARTGHGYSGSGLHPERWVPRRRRLFFGDTEDLEGKVEGFPQNGGTISRSSIYLF